MTTHTQPHGWKAVEVRPGEWWARAYVNGKQCASAWRGGDGALTFLTQAECERWIVDNLVGLQLIDEAQAERDAACQALADAMNEAWGTSLYKRDSLRVRALVDLGVVVKKDDR